MALVCCAVSGITVAWSVQWAGATPAKIETPVQAQKVPSALKPYSNLHVVQHGIGAEAKTVLRHSARADHKNRKKSHRAKLDRKGANPNGRGTLPSGAGRKMQDLAYYGILEPPQRYDPVRRLRKSQGAAPNPEARDLQVEHFQELDRNQDGVIDPLERAVGRLDIERDMSNR